MRAAVGRAWEFVLVYDNLEGIFVVMFCLAIVVFIVSLRKL